MTIPDPDFWRGRRVLVTGHTGFKGAWLCAWLERMGATVTGFALAPEPGPNLFRDMGGWSGVTSVIGDIRDIDAVESVCRNADAEVAIHMAAQSLVRRGHRDPQGTFATNVQGTGNLLQALDRCPDLEAILVVTSDKCYRNDNSGRPFVETDPLGGRDPYSASKATQETLAIGWRRGLLESRAGAPRLATARAGNVIGGGDWAEDRILPDLFRAAETGEPLEVRNPGATRPWQHVLDVLAGYLCYVESLAAGGGRMPPPALNFGPQAVDARPVSWLVDHAVNRLRTAGHDTPDWITARAGGPTEAAALALDPRLAQTTIGWGSRLSQEDAVAWTADWHAQAMAGKPVRDLVRAQIEQFSKAAAA
ncbi:MAG: CDP-glucose 4,6-dehydratase [Alphaproteobacteria bacterium]|nr:CDP-glucose 4,6-dehydratase [Alphaproteobacteria bacterium]